MENSVTILFVTYFSDKLISKIIREIDQKFKILIIEKSRNTSTKKKHLPKNNVKVPINKKKNVQITDEMIEQLESDLKNIETELSIASENGNIAKITELGEKHKEITHKLEEALRNW